jgi:electron transfer flavoprotein alpha subunit
MSNGILVFVEHREGTLNKVSLEAIAAAQQIASALQQEVTAVVLGSGVAEVAQAIAPYAVKRVVLAENAKLKDYTPDGYTDAMSEVIKTVDPAYVVLPHTYLVRDFAPKLAARFSRSMVTDCIRSSVEGGKVRLTRRIFLGKLDADFIADDDVPVFITFQSGAFRPDAAQRGSATAPVETMPVSVGEIRMKPEPPFQESKQSVDLTKAEVIVAVGRGIKSQENIALAQQLADVLGGDIAASRPICDAEWLPIDRQIGSSGQTVAPKVYLALGISGAIQHLVGMKNSGTIIAINKDAEAPIFDIADYGIVGDLFEAVPALIEEVKKLKG